MSRISVLKACTSLSDVATLLDLKPKTLSYLLFRQPESSKYKIFQIPKRKGGLRTISAPINGLKIVQRRLSNLLQDCLHEINTAKHYKDRAAHGFKRNRSIITNARRHRHRRWVFNIDLEDFFPTINFGRVRGFFLKNKDFLLHERVATVIAQIACHNNSLPQGSPCSPVISNLVAHVLDMRLVKLACEVGCTYSRYADDLTFSTNKKNFPHEIAMPWGMEGPESHLWVPGDALTKIIERTDFRINREKTHQMYRVSRQSVTGLVVNKKINVRWEYRHNVRAMVHRLITTGTFEVLGVKHKDGAVVLEKRPGTNNELHGMLGFVDSIDVYNKADSLTARPAKRSSSEEVYRQFLFYSMFYAAQIPVVICEGETDNVYLTHAIRSLWAEFPALAELVEGKVRLKIRLFKYPKTSTARLLDLKDGGSSVLSHFIGAYNNEIREFSGPGLTEPVIILYDNDSGAKNIRNVIKSVSKKTPDGTEPFVHVIKNLYAVPTPRTPDNRDSKIEDFFDASIKATIWDGKTFNSDNDIDVEKHYGKKVFAHKVILPKASTLDFGGFRPLLTNLSAAIARHRGSVLPLTHITLPVRTLPRT